MGGKPTEELEAALQSAHVGDLDSYFHENRDEIIDDDRPFAQYMRSRINEKKLSRTTIFLDADIPQNYGYKLLSEEKRTKQRDVILRLCYAAHFTFRETQEALKIYRMPRLYAKDPRDVILIVALNQRPGDIEDINDLLVRKNFEPLKPCGDQD